MEICDFPLICYWDGEVLEQNGCVSYRGGNQCFILASTKMSYLQLVEEIYKGIGIQSMGTQLRVKMKFPSSGCYKVVALNNEGAFKALWASVRHSNAPSMDIFVEISTSQVVNPTPSIRLDDVAQFVSLETNDINDGEFDGNLQGDEIDEDLAILDENLLANEEDGIDDDLVFASAPIVEFNKVDQLDEDELNSWKTWDNIVRQEEGKEFAVGQMFPNKASLSDEVTSYSVKANQFFEVAESKPNTITFKCGRSPTPCNWRLRATQKDFHSKAFTIVTYKGPHDESCVCDMVPRDHINLKRAFISHEIRNLVEGDWGYKVNSVVTHILDKYGYTISYTKAWNAKQRAIEEIFGDWDKSYEVIPRFMQGLKESNPGTIVQFVTKPTTNPNVQTFKRVFWAFKPCIDGFEHCRSVLSIDGTHLYGKFKGTILTAMSIDANNQIFPVAFAIVESENTDSWPWFMAFIRVFVTKRSGLCVISDRHKVPPHFRSMVSNIREYSAQSLQHVGYSHLLHPNEMPREENTPTDHESLDSMDLEDDVPLVQYTRRTRQANTSMSPINEQGTPEPSKGKGFWSRLRGKKKK